MALPVQNINHSAFRSMFEREKLSENIFNDWFRQLKLVLRVENKMFVIEQSIPSAPAANVPTECNEIYDAYNEVACLMLERYMDQLERLGYVLPQDIRVGLILNGLTRDFAGFVKNYNMHNIGKTIGELHAMLIDNGIYEIDMHDLVPNVNSIYNVSTKRAKHNLDSTYLWHCRLAHISKKRIEKLQQEGLLKLTNNESFDQCESCLSGKMTKKPFPHRLERATDILGIIHTDVCGLIRYVSRQGAIYFITFNEDYSRYGFVYLLKHKHELTPPYTPQHNGVSERRNCTSLDMVRSMTNLTTLLLSFWDYALESATSILNMVLTKKVDKTPYELWYAEFFEKSLITQEVSGRAIDLEEIQDKVTSPSEITSEIPMEVEGFEAPQDLEDLNEPASYKAAMLDLESNKLLDAMNAEMQSMIDNKVWVLVNLPPNCKTVRKAAFILGIKIYKDRSKRLIGLSQSAYTDKILKRYMMDNSKRGHIPMQERLDLNKTQGASILEEVKRMKNVPYASDVGSIIDDIKSQTGYVFVLNGGTVDWKSFKQSTTAMSATEAEYIVASKATMEAVWIRKFISWLGIVPTINKPIKMFCDNSTALLIGNEPEVQKGARHYHRRYHYVRECIELGEINLLKVHTYDNLADLFTKALPKRKLTQHARSI
nr:hypothetical protein [Tanacetum cinerariifolium]